jgi:hypothetical protein
VTKDESAAPEAAGFDAAGIAEEIIRNCGGDARAAVVELISIVRHLAEEVDRLNAADSPGFVRRAPER